LAVAVEGFPYSDLPHGDYYRLYSTPDTNSGTIYLDNYLWSDNISDNDANNGYMQNDNLFHNDQKLAIAAWIPYGDPVYPKGLFGGNTNAPWSCSTSWTTPPVTIGCLDHDYSIDVNMVQSTELKVSVKDSAGFAVSGVNFHTFSNGLSQLGTTDAAGELTVGIWPPSPPGSVTLDSTLWSDDPTLSHMVTGQRVISFEENSAAVTPYDAGQAEPGWKGWSGTAPAGARIAGQMPFAVRVPDSTVYGGYREVGSFKTGDDGSYTFASNYKFPFVNRGMFQATQDTVNPNLYEMTPPWDYNMVLWRSETMRSPAYEGYGDPLYYPLGWGNTAYVPGRLYRYRVQGHLYYDTNRLQPAANVPMGNWYTATAYEDGTLMPNITSAASNVTDTNGYYNAYFYTCDGNFDVQVQLSGSSGSTYSIETVLPQADGKTCVNLHDNAGLTATLSGGTVYCFLTNLLTPETGLEMDLQVKLGHVGGM